MSQPETKPVRVTRAQKKAATREKILAQAGMLFRGRSYDDVGLRDVAEWSGITTGAIFAHFAGKAELYEAALGFPHPWRPIETGVKDGRPYLLLVDYTEETNAAAVKAQGDAGYLWSGNALADADIARTIGHNNRDNDGEDRWQFAGWCWSHDHYTEGHGTPIACIDLDAVAPEAVQP